MSYLIVPYLIRCICEVGIVEEFQVYHAVGKRYVECYFLRFIVGNVDTFMLDTNTCRTLRIELIACRRGYNISTWLLGYGHCVTQWT